MSRTRLQRVLLVLGFLFAGGSVPDAAAQLGKLKKVLGGKAVEGNQPACLPSRPPTYVETVNLTAEEMAKINAGFDAELQTAQVAFQKQDQEEKAYEAESKAYEKARAEYDKSKAKWDACAGKVASADAATSEKLNQQADASGKAVEQEVDEDKIVKMAERAQAAAERVSKGTGTAEDRATLAEYQRMMAGVQGVSNQAIAASQKSQEFDRGASERVEKACGKEPVEPKAPTPPSPPGNQVRDAGAKAAGMDAGAYAAGRDEMIGLASSNSVVKADKASQGGGGKDQANGKGDGKGKVSQEQADAMNEAIKAAGKKICDLRKAGAPI